MADNNIIFIGMPAVGKMKLGLRVHVLITPKIIMSPIKTSKNT